MKNAMLDLYAEYLISSFSYTTATGLSEMTEGQISHDRVSRFLNEDVCTGKMLWKIVKPIIRKLESEAGFVVFDDTIEEKPYTDENEIVAWHYDHSKGRSLKGINIVNALYVNDQCCLPINYDIVSKTKIIIDEKTGKEKRISEETKNEKYRRMLGQIVKNGIKFRYVLNDVWYASAENMVYVKETIKKDFIMPVKSNRKVSLSRADQRQQRFVSVSTLALKKGTVQEVYLEDVTFPILLCKQIFKNEDGTTGELYLVSSNKSITYDLMAEFYKRRWKIEEFHKSLKNNVSLAKSQTRVQRTQRNHIFACMYAFIKLELLKMKTHLNHFAIKASIYAKAVKVAFEELQNLNGLHITLAR